MEQDANPPAPDGLSEEERRRRADPNHWFNDHEDNRRRIQYDRELYEGKHGGNVLAAMKKMAERGQTTVTINGKEYPTLTPEYFES